jgi:signal transduction histidine kinase
MPPKDPPPTSERQHTDESLRVERERTDQALGDQLADIDEAADAVICKARARADAVLAAARANTDRASGLAVSGSQSLQRDRVLEDQTLRDERADADATLRTERAETVAPLSIEREHTDTDLSTERAWSDDALAARDEFLGIVSHDLRSMLHTMLASAELIAMEASPENPLTQVLMHVKRIERAGTRMERLIGDLIDVAGLDSGLLALTRDVGDPAQVVTEAVDAFQAQASASGVSLVAEFIPPSSRTAFDPARILQVLVNLLSNAIKFTRPQGRVVARVERVGADIRFAVSDTGVGIPTDKLEAVFDRSFQVARNDRRGVGLGLYISKCIVEAHGGRIWAESVIGEGSTFYFTLPLHVAVPT